MSPPAWLPPEIFAQYVGRFRGTGFAGGLGYYRNIDDNWRELIAHLRRSEDVMSGSRARA